MKPVSHDARIRAVIGLIAAYVIALQAVFTALAPVPVNAQGADLAGWHVLCFGGGNTAASDTGDPASPAPASGMFHCILCGPAAAAAAILPEATAAFAPHHAVSAHLFAPAPGVAPTRRAVRAGPARAPPLTV